MDSFTIAGALAIGAFALYLRNFFSQPSIKPKPPILKKDFKKDTVYLYQYARLKKCPHLSPFCMKIDMLCRVYNIPFEVVVCTSERSRNGLLPFIELNGEHIADSSLIEMRLKSHFKIQPLQGELEAQSVALSKLVDTHLFFILVRFKIAVQEYYEVLYSCIGLPRFLSFIMIPILKATIGKSVYTKSAGAIGEFEWDELDQFLHKDLQAIQTLMKGKYLLGDTISSADITLFSHLATVYYPLRCHVSDVLEKDFPKILEYCERIRKEVYPNDFTL
ncbi:hypothetical protein CRE_12986 [Caenorhabditis remanei]|uniref:Uncharacterized protein n=1 Tax=Caenorhabditis remanei TaxID=31234 RepID=E3N147_CAERE|nr:hypothetical protein CRE_12986 [Caenorhabditis remanei]